MNMTRSNIRWMLLALVLVAVAAVAAIVAAGSFEGRPGGQRSGMAQQSSAPAAPPAAMEPLLPAGRAETETQTFRAIARAQAPMVVNIRTESRRQTADLSRFYQGDELWERFFGLPGPGAPGAPSRPRDEIMQGAGSGFIVDRRGLILTNNHVVGGASRIAVALYGADAGVEYDARVVGRDPLTDSALIELTEQPDRELPQAVLGRSADAQPGDWVMAIGNPFNLTHTVTVGVISAVGRPFPISEGRWQEVLQTDAAINPGNSGGPLLNVRGEVIGINTAIYTGGPIAANVGVGFAMPIDVIRDLLPELRQGNVMRGRIGVSVTPVTSELVAPLGLSSSQGALVRMVERGGPADEAGIEPGDVVVRVDGRPIASSDDLSREVSSTRPGTTLSLTIVRDRQQQERPVTVGLLEIQDGTARQSGAGPTAGGEFGVMLQDLDARTAPALKLPPGTGGALVTQVEPSGDAARSGLRPGDIIQEINRTEVRSAGAAARLLQDTPPGGTALVLVWRDGQRVFLTMTRR